MLARTTIHDEPTYLSLEILASEALARGDIQRAFELADRRCRTPPTAQPHCYLLRAEICFRLGMTSYALDDLDEVLASEPDNVEANRRMMSWSDGDRQRAAARSLLQRDRNSNVLRQALAILEQDGEKRQAVIQVMAESIEGWAVWDDATPIEVSIASGRQTVSTFVEPDPHHPLSSPRTFAAGFSMKRPRSTVPQLASVMIAGEPIRAERMSPNEKVARAASRPAASRPATSTTVIVPIYADFEATRACIESLLDALARTEETADVILVDDASPDQRIKRYLDALAPRANVAVITNRQNLGFVGSINRALAEAAGSDVILLNSDTIVAPGFVERLREAAHSAPDIGIVNPLSNNGDFSSFPLPNEANDLRSLDHVVEIDRIAATANSGRIVDLPSAIGFCMFVTRQCLDAVGPLSESFRRGYLEDVDFCLRARAAGFRSVCAPSVYVGHVGTRSFRSEKRALVAHNIGILDHRFPDYRAECRAFVAADPLRRAREAIERQISYPDRHPRVLLTGRGAVAEIAAQRARQLAADGQHALIVTLQNTSDATVANVKDAAGEAPQSLSFDLTQATELEAFDRLMIALEPSGFEIIEPGVVPDALRDLLARGQRGYDVLIADGAFVTPTRPRPADRLLPRTAASRWRNLARQADRILVPCPAAAAFAERHFPDLPVTLLAAPQRRTIKRSPDRFSDGSLGILFLPGTPLAALQVLLQAIGVTAPHLPIVVIGRTTDDMALMRLPGVFVTGAVNSVEFDRLVRQYRIGTLLTGVGRPLFGHPLQIAAADCGLPIAWLDWSMGLHRAASPDLAIDASIEPRDIAGAIARWREGL